MYGKNMRIQPDKTENNGKTWKGETRDMVVTRNLWSDWRDLKKEDKN